MLKVFVYGTLKPGEENYHRFCAAKVTDVQRAIARGQLFDLKLGYPAMILGNSPVCGYLLSFASEAVLNELDELEDYQPTRQTSKNLYNRHQIEIYNLQGDSLGNAWVYVMSEEKVQQLGGVILPNGWWTNSDKKSITD